MDPYESWVERQIREAQERGELDNLPGAGKPLRGLESEDPDWWVKQLVRREGLDLRTEESVRAVLEDYNRRVGLDRLRPAVGPLPPVLARTVEVDELVDQWRALRAERKEEEPPRQQSVVRALPSNPSLARYASEPWWRRLADLVRGR